jgi:hypothetical protein
MEDLNRSTEAFVQTREFIPHWFDFISDSHSTKFCVQTKTVDMDCGPETPSE